MIAVAEWVDAKRQGKSKANEDGWYRNGIKSAKPNTPIRIKTFEPYYRFPSCVSAHARFKSLSAIYMPCQWCAVGSSPTHGNQAIATHVGCGNQAHRAP